MFVILEIAGGRLTKIRLLKIESNRKANPGRITS